MFRIALPVVITYLGQMTMNLVDLLFVGRVSPAAIGAVSVGTSLYSWAMIFGLGLLSGLDFVVSHSHGSGRTERAHLSFSQGLIIATLTSIPLMLLLEALSYRLDWLGINSEVAPLATPYLRVLAFSHLPMMIYTAGRMYLLGFGVAKPTLMIMILANGINILANYILVFGHWGAPALSATGSAWATLLSRIWMMLAMIAYLYAWDRKRGGQLLRNLFRYSREEMTRLLGLGIPAALQMTSEVGAFALASTLAARLTTPELAAHQIVMNIASTTFMVPLGVGSAAAVLVGRSIGRGDLHEAASFGWRGFALGVGFMTFTCITMILFPTQILGFYTNDSSVMAVGKQILLIGGLFQVFDGTQVVGAGTLRGLGNTRIAMISNLIGYWIIALPIGISLCFYAGYGLRGLWIGLSLGLISVAVALLFAWQRKVRDFRPVTGISVTSGNTH